MNRKAGKIRVRSLYPLVFLAILISVPYILALTANDETADSDELIWWVANYGTEWETGSYADTYTDDTSYWCTGYDQALSESENHWYSVLDFDLSAYGIGQGNLDSLTFEWRGYAGGWNNICDPGTADNPECFDVGVCEPSYIWIRDWDSGSWDTFHTSSYTLDDTWDTNQQTIIRSNTTPEDGWINTSGWVRMAFEHHETGMDQNWETKIATDYASLDVTYTTDTTPPVLTFANPTPDDETKTVTFAYVNVTADETLSAANLEWNGTNESMSGSGTNWYLNKTDLYNGNYTFKVWGSDEAGNWGATATTRWVNISYTTTLAGTVTDDGGTAITCNISTYDENNNFLANDTTDTFSWDSIHSGWYVEFNCSDTENVSAKFRISGDASGASVKLNNFGSSKPGELSDPSGNPIKYVNVSAYGLAFGSVGVKIYYDDTGLGGENENKLDIYHWTGSSWDDLNTTLDIAANTVNATTASLSPFAVTYALPSTTGNYRGTDIPPAVELTNLAKSCGQNSTGDQVCHLVTPTWPTPTPAVGPNNYMDFHPGAERNPASFFPLFVHRHHGGDNWPHWSYSASGTEGGGTLTNISTPLTGTLYTGQTGYADDLDGMITGSNINVDDLVIRRNRYETDDGVTYTTEPFRGNPQGNNGGRQEIMATCSWAEFGDYTAFIGCHGIWDTAGQAGADSGTYDLKDPRTDPILCKDCHNESGTGTLGINHGSKSDCGECHIPGYTATTVLSGNNPNATAATHCDSSCHDQITAALRNNTYLHAGVDCRYCHGHAHNVSGYYSDDGTWNVSCGNASSACHSTGATAPANVGTVYHNVSGSSVGPTCADCHTTGTATAKGHNITIPSCSRCHNSTGNGGVSATNTTVPAWINQEYLSVIGANATHGHDTDYGGRGNYSNISCKFCHNATSYHSDPGLKYGANGFETCNNTNCHGTGGAGQTVVSTHSNVSCAACHNNDTIKSASASGAVTLSTNIHASNSSWLIPFNITADNLTNAQCILCHDDSSIIDTGLNCSKCHAITEIHDPEMGFMGVVVDGYHDLPNPNCTRCHDIDGNGPAPTWTKVNVTKMNATGATHTDLNNDTTPSGDWTNRMCWACHTNETVRSDNKIEEAELPGNDHPDWYDNVTCRFCHDNKTRLMNFTHQTQSYVEANYYQNFTAYNSSAHARGHIDAYPALVFFEMVCWDCHDKHAATAQECRNCHDNRTHLQTLDDSINPTVADLLYQNYTSFNSSAHRYGNLTVTGLTDVNLVEFGCPDCHSSHEVHLTHCSDCHGNRTLLNDTYINESSWQNNDTVLETLFKNTTTFDSSAHAEGQIDAYPGQTFLEMECWDCHEAHAVTLQECTDCHNNKSKLMTLDDTINSSTVDTIYQNATKFNNSAHGTGNLTEHGVEDVNLAEFKCQDCHSSHEVHLTQCSNCHGNRTYMNDTYLNGSSWQNNDTVLNIIFKNTTAFNNSAHGTGNLTESGFESVNLAEFDCWDCHEAHAVTLEQCSDCHDNRTRLNDTYLNGSSWQNNETVLEYLYKNNTKFNNSAHGTGNLTEHGVEDVNLAEFECWDCHDAHAVAPQDCSDCHGNRTHMNSTYLNGSSWQNNDTVLDILFKNATAFINSAHGTGNLSNHGVEDVNLAEFDCWDCHEAHAVTLQQCSECHDNRTLLNDTYLTGSNWENNETVLNYLFKNNTAFNNSAHGTGNLSNHGVEDVNLAEFECWDCHDAHAVAAQDCSECHSNRTLLNDTYLTGSDWENNDTVLDYLYKNYTTFNSSAHRYGNLTLHGLENVDLATFDCWTCHSSHEVELLHCKDCHSNKTYLNDTYLTGSDWENNETVLNALYHNYTPFNSSAHRYGNLTGTGLTDVDLVTFDCWDCHEAHAVDLKHCSDCHGNRTLLNSTYMNESSWEDNDTVMDYLFQNWTTFNASAHAEGQIDAYPGETFFQMECWDCHDAHAVSAQECRTCHDNRTHLQTLDDSINATVAAKLYKNYTPFNSSAHGYGNLTGTGLENVDLVTFGCQDCHSSHEVELTHCQDCHDNRTWLNNTITAQIGENDTVLEFLYQNYTAFTQADHGEGLNCSNCHDAHAVETVGYCTDCHYNGTDPDGLGNYSAPLVYEHTPPASTGTVNTSASCEACHNNSVLSAAVTDSNTLSLKANVSHYLTNTSIKPGGNDTTDCTTCHRNATLAKEWYLQRAGYVNYTIRHGDDNATFCGKCHNSTNVGNLHAQKIYLPWYVHKEYDWEDDDDNEGKWGVGKGTGWKWESCMACHYTYNRSEMNQYTPRKCEDCHINGSIGPYNKTDEDEFYLRGDWRESMPMVYEHIFENATYLNSTGDAVNVTGVEVSTGNVSELVPVPAFDDDVALRNSTCLGWSNDTQEGFCHGVASTNTSDGYYAFSNKSTGFNLTNGTYNPYYYNAPVDWLPDTRNCTYCHAANASVKMQWGNATAISTSTKRTHTAIDLASPSKCFECHVNASSPFNFHSMELNGGVGGPDCVGCHDTGRSYAPDVDVSKMNATTAIHKNLNNGTANTTTLTDLIDKACWACHGDGSQPVSHPSNYRAPKNCPDCHTNATGGYNASNARGNYSAPFIYEHNPFSTGDVTTTAYCQECHNNSVAANNDAENGTTINNSKKSNTSHYGITANLVNTTNCTDCHKVASNADKWGHAIVVSDDMGDANSQCYLCHMDTVSVPPNTSIGFHEGNVTEWSWESCDTCHATGGRR